MTDDIDPDEELMLAAEYALGLLAPEEAAAFEQLMARDADFREEYEAWAENLADLTDDIAPVTPPPALLNQIRAAAFGTAAVAAPQPEEVEPPATAPVFETATAQGRGLLQRLGLLPAVGGGLLAALVALWVIDATIGPSLALPTATATLVSEDESLVVEIAYTDDGEWLEFNRRTGRAPEGQDLQLWLINGDRAPISLGVLPAAQTGQLRVPEDYRQLLHGGNCAISVEPLGGSPTGAPTGEVVAIAPIVWET